MLTCHPRHTKSEFASYLLPAWMVGRNPKLKIIQATHTGELAVRFGRKAKTLIDSEEYSKIFETSLREDSVKPLVGGKQHKVASILQLVSAVQSPDGVLTLLIIDDPHSEQDAMSANAFDNAYEWYTSGPTTTFTTRWSDSFSYD